MPALRIAELSGDPAVLEAARAAAFQIAASDPSLARPEHAGLRAHLETRFAERQALAEIG
jgi:hypothetical protein